MRIRRDRSVYFAQSDSSASFMQLFLPCNGCGNPIPIPEYHFGLEGPEVLDCENCGQQITWRVETAELREPDSPQEFALELELETALDWNVLGPAVPRRRQKEVSAFRKIVPPVLGGLAAFPIATLIMWYGFGKDIGSTGPTVSQYVPWIVPQKFHARAWDLPRRDFRSAPNRNAPRSNSTSEKNLPSLNRENPTIVVPESRKVTADSPSIDNRSPAKKTPEMHNEMEGKETKSESSKPESSKPALSETIAELRALQLTWESTPMADRTKMLQSYSASIKQLSEQSSQLSGRSANVWRKDLEKLAREILAHAKIPRAIELGATGKLTGVPTASPEGFIATVIKLGDGNDPKPNETWSLHVPWSSHRGDIPVEVLAGAWRANSILPTTCLVLGQLIQSESSESEFVLRAHLILPE